MKKLLKEYKRQLDKNPQDAMYHYLYGRLLEGKEQVKEFKRALQLDSNFAWGYYGLAGARLSNIDTNQAIEYYQKALQLKPDLGNVYYWIAWIYSEKGMHEEAMKAYKHLFEKYPGDRLAPACINGYCQLTKKPQEKDSLYYQLINKYPWSRWAIYDY